MCLRRWVCEAPPSRGRLWSFRWFHQTPESLGNAWDCPYCFACYVSSEIYYLRKRKKQNSIKSFLRVATKIIYFHIEWQTVDFLFNRESIPPINKVLARCRWNRSPCRPGKRTFQRSTGPPANGRLTVGTKNFIRQPVGVLMGGTLIQKSSLEKPLKSNPSKRKVAEGYKFL